MRLEVSLMAYFLLSAVVAWADDVPSLRASSHHPPGHTRAAAAAAAASSATPSSDYPTTRNAQRRSNDNGNSSGNGSGNSSSGKGHKHNHNHHNHHSPEYEFVKWCKTVLGITSSLRIDRFEYYDYMQALKDQTDVFSDDDDDILAGLPPTLEGIDDDPFDDATVSVADYRRILERGLAAAHDIQVGETLIQVPYQSLWTVENAIDFDPILSKVMGAKFRRLYGWDGQGDASMRRYYELPLLAIALLHHCKLKGQSPYWPYLQLLQTTPVDSIPFTWNRTRLKTEASPGVRRIARGIQRDIYELYAGMVKILIEEHPDLFGKPGQTRLDIVSSDDDEDGETNSEDDDEDNEGLDRANDEWMFSFQKFRWAFAIVNSRHWHLPVPPRKQYGEEVISAPTTPNEKSEKSKKRYRPNEEVFYEEEDVADYNVDEPPPAAMPTDEWVRHQQRRAEEKTQFEDKASADKKGAAGDDDDNDVYGMEQSFLLPFAELLNFGPPCTRGFFNRTSQSFEIVATCPFRKGQEVTFWYSDACSDVIIGNYGFTHPMVPKCATLGDWRRRANVYEQQVDDLQFELISVYEELRTLDDDLGTAAKMLADCNCPPKAGMGARDVEIDGGDLASVPTPRKPIGSPQVNLPIGNANFHLEDHNGIRGESASLKRGSTRIQQLKRSRHRRRSSLKSQPDL